MSSIVRKNKFPFTLGGEHSLTWATVNGISEVLGKKIGIVQIDAHADLVRIIWVIRTHMQV